MKVKDFLKSNCKKFVAVASGFTMAVAPVSYSLVASAEESSGNYTALENAMTSSMSATTNSMISVIGKILPYVLVVVGAVLVITLGIRLFKKFGKG